jgi:hypothetical protein
VCDACCNHRSSPLLASLLIHDDVLLLLTLQPISHLPCLLLCRQRRRDELVQVQQGISEAFAASLVGQEVRTAGLVRCGFFWTIVAAASMSSAALSTCTHTMCMGAQHMCHVGTFKSHLSSRRDTRQPAERELQRYASLLISCAVFTMLCRLKCSWMGKTRMAGCLVAHSGMRQMWTPSCS